MEKGKCKMGIRDFSLFHSSFPNSIRVFIVPVRTMFATAFAAIPALEVVLFGEDNEPGFAVIEVFRV